MKNRLFQIVRLVSFGLVIGVAFYGFHGMFTRVCAVFLNDQEDMAHGWLIPLFSLFVLYKERKEFRAVARAPSFVGLLASLPFLALAFLGSRGLQVRFEQVAFAGLCIAIPWTFWGRHVARLCLFPAAFLLLTIPLSSFLDFATIHLRLLASSIAVSVLNGLGFAAARSGTAIYSTGTTPFSIDIADPCAGLHYLSAMIALTAAYAWFAQPTWLRRGILFVCAVPFAVIGNIVRTLLICVVAACASQEIATTFYHDFSGYVIFIPALLLMFLVSDLITRLSRRHGKEAVAVPSGPVNPAPVVGWRLVVVPVLACIVFLPCFLNQAAMPASSLAEAPRLVLPESLPGYGVDSVRYCHDEKCAAAVLGSKLSGPGAPCPVCGGPLFGISLGEQTILPADTRIVKRVYEAPNGTAYVVTLVIGGASKSSIHRPELCLPAQGFTMLAPRTIEAGGRPFRVIAIVRPGAPGAALVYTFQNQTGFRTASHTRRIFTDVWDRSVHNRIDRWAMITVNAAAPAGFDPGTAGDAAALRAFLEAFCGALVPSAPLRGEGRP